MGSFFSLFQGALFATLNTTLFAHLAKGLDRGQDSSGAARMLVLFAGLMFLLGTVFSRAVSVRRDPASGVLASGGVGLFLAAMVAVYTTALLAVLVQEVVLVLPAALFAVYVFSAISEKAWFTAPAVALFLLVVGLVAFSDVPFADPLAAQVGALLDLPSSKRTKGVLETPGGLFGSHMAAPVIISLFALVVAK